MEGVLRLVAEWIHFTLFGIVLPTLKPKVYTFGGLMNSATKYTREFVFVRLLNYQRFQKVLAVRFEGCARMLLIGCQEWGL